MNERIKELAVESKVNVGSLFAEMLYNDSEVNVKIAEAWNDQPDDVRQRIFQVIGQNQEKFAKLIVKECAQYIEDKFDFCGDEIYAADQLRKHFGVE